MERMNFDTYEELTEYMTSVSSEGYSIVAVMSFSGVTELLRELLMIDDIDIGFIEMVDTTSLGYEEEYYVGLDDEMTLSVANTKNQDGEYRDIPADIALFDGDVNSKTINHVRCSITYEIEVTDGVGVYDDYDGENECEDCSCDCCNCRNAQLVKETLGFLELANHIMNHTD